MKTWNGYKEHVRTVDPEIRKKIDEIKNISSIVSAMVEQRTVKSIKPTIKRAAALIFI